MNIEKWWKKWHGYKRQFEAGELAMHKLTKEKVIVLHNTPGAYFPMSLVTIRRKNFETMSVYEDELKHIKKR